jgi:hypothetical protein
VKRKEDVMKKVYKKNEVFFFECEEGIASLVDAYEEKVPFRIENGTKEFYGYSPGETDRIDGYSNVVIALVTERYEDGEVERHLPIGESFPDGSTDIVLTDDDLYGWEQTIAWECNGYTTY